MRDVSNRPNSVVRRPSAHSWSRFQLSTFLILIGFVPVLGYIQVTQVRHVLVLNSVDAWVAEYGWPLRCIETYGDGPNVMRRDVNYMATAIDIFISLLLLASVAYSWKNLSSLQFYCWPINWPFLFALLFSITVFLLAWAGPYNLTSLAKDADFDVNILLSTLAWWQRLPIGALLGSLVTSLAFLLTSPWLRRYVRQLFDDDEATSDV